MMRNATICFLIFVMVTFVGCGSELHTSKPQQSRVNESVASLPAGPIRTSTPQAGQAAGRPEIQSQTASLQAADSAQTSTQAIERKIIRNAEISIETDSPNDAQRKIAAIAEKHGGFVVTSESRENPGNNQQLPATTVTVVARVPAAKFGEAVEEIHRLGGRILREKISGQDVTEEYIDLEARIRTKRALEMQFLEIMKQARKVSDALEVQNQLAEVRTEIERLEGRRRFLENQSALSTITIALQTPAPIVAATTSGFWYGVKTAFGDGLDTAAEIVLGIIRFVIVMIPVLIFILLPCWFAFKWLRRHIDWPKKTEPVLSVDNQAE
jgi:hypothetical protein